MANASTSRSLIALCVVMAVLMCWPIRVCAEPITPSFSDWHWPLPAGEWMVDRGPCDSPLANNHSCDYYEDKCALDLAAVTGETEYTPVLAPQSGQVLFVGQRPNTGIEVMLQHPDGRVSALYYLSKAVVETDQYIRQGEVVGYIGHTGTSRPRLHFHVQPNEVQRQCLPINGLDDIDYPTRTITSYNTRMEQLLLVNPPQPLLDRLPPVVISDVATSANTHLAISENQQAILLVQLTGVISDTTLLRGWGGRESTVLTRTPGGPIFKVLFESYNSRAGQTYQNVSPNSAQSRGLTFSLIYTIEPFINMSPTNKIVLPNPTYISPVSFSRWDVTPKLCWRYPEKMSNRKHEFRVYIIGPEILESTWSDNQCTRPPILSAGIYYWKVVVRDELGNMNSPNQWPSAFIITE